MKKQKDSLISKKLLKKNDKILIVTQLALGDFTYMQTYIKALKKMYPHLEIHLWMHENRTSFLKKEKINNDTLYGWLRSCKFLDKLYVGTYDRSVFNIFYKQARQQDYQLAVSLAFNRPFNTARLARKLAPNAFIAGIKHNIKPWKIIKWWRYQALDVAYSINYPKDFQGHHINDLIADWYEKILGVVVPVQDRKPNIDVPEAWSGYGAKKLTAYGFLSDRIDCKATCIFINTFAKDRKRCWPLERVVNLIKGIGASFPNQRFAYIVNAVPARCPEVQEIITKAQLKNVAVFSAENDFFELPSIIAACDFVISVETSVMHFAAACNIPVLALMRSKNLEWVPWGDKDIHLLVTKNIEQPVSDITTNDVIEKLGTIW